MRRSVILGDSRMAKRTLILAVALISIMVPSAVLADPQSCDGECPSGQVMTSSAVGDEAVCACVAAGPQMVETDETPIICDNPNDDGTSC